MQVSIKYNLYFLLILYSCFTFCVYVSAWVYMYASSIGMCMSDMWKSDDNYQERHLPP